MVKNLYLLSLFSILCSQNLKIYPEFFYKYESNSEQYSISNLPLQNYELTFIGDYSLNKLNIYARVGYHLIDGIQNARPNDFTRQQGLHYFEKPAGIADDQSNYYISDMKIEYGDSINYFYLNKWDQHWGPGVNSLIISSKIPRFVHFGFKWRIKDKLHFEYFHGKLKSSINDDMYSTSYYTELDGVGGRLFNISRSIAGHRIEWEPFNNFIISASELIVYANRSIELTYLLPFVAFFPIQTYVGETDNVIMSGDIQYFINNDFRIYGAFMMDEWSPPYTFDEDNRNWFGWQLGIEYKNMFIEKSRFRMEFTWTDHRIYRHRFPVNDFYSWGYPVGFWAGPHAQEFFMNYNFKFHKFNIEIMYSDAKRGLLTDEMLIDQYERPNSSPIYKRFDGMVEEKTILHFSFNRNVYNNINLDLSYTFVDWKGAGFNPKLSNKDDNLPRISKHSLGIVVKYWFM